MVRVWGWSGPSTRRKSVSRSRYWSAAWAGCPAVAQPAGEVAAGGEGVGVVGSQHPQVVGEQVAVLVGGLGGLPGLAQQ